MQYIPLPTTDQPLLSITTTLDGEQFRITYDWNSVTDRWSMRISDVNGDLLASGVKLVPNTPLLRNVADATRPKGVMFMFSVGDVEATIDTIDSCKLVYIEEDEIEK